VSLPPDVTRGKRRKDMDRKEENGKREREKEERK
jgi:hypothetical protein